MNKIFLPFLLSTLTLILTLTAHAQLTRPEKAAITYINGHMNEAMQLLTETVNINSGTLNIEGVKKGGCYLCRRA